jgi:hypothetical protein
MKPERAYRLPLHLHPRRFRREYGDRMLEDFRELQSELRSSRRPVGPPPRGLRATSDLR